MKNLLFLLLITFVDAKAQNLSNVQRSSLKAPGDIKIDGKDSEWNNHYQAYNHATEFFYTLSNDENNLYFILKCTKSDIITKLIMGGVTLTIYPDESGKNNNGMSVTFPMYDNKNQPFYLSVEAYSKTARDLEKDRAQIDSIRKMYNVKLVDRFKLIGVDGIKSIEDSLISIYNTDGIKTAALFNEKLDLIYELSIPLKYFKQANPKMDLIKYRVQLNGTPRGGGGIKFVETSRGDRMIYTAGDGMNYDLGQNVYNNFPTNFKGEYKLEK